MLILPSNSITILQCLISVKQSDVDRFMALLAFVAYPNPKMQAADPRTEAFDHGSTVVDT